MSPHPKCCIYEDEIVVFIAVAVMSGPLARHFSECQSACDRCDALFQQFYTPLGKARPAGHMSKFSAVRDP